MATAKYRDSATSASIFDPVKDCYMLSVHGESFVALPWPARSTYLAAAQPARSVYSNPSTITKPQSDPSEPAALSFSLDPASDPEISPEQNHTSPES